MVPLYDEIRTVPHHDIADSAGANDFDAFCDWIDRNALYNYVPSNAPR